MEGLKNSPYTTISRIKQHQFITQLRTGFDFIFFLTLSEISTFHLFDLIIEIDESSTELRKA